MAQWHHIFCCSDAALPCEELTDYISDSWYGDSLPDITSTPHGTTWHELIVELPGASSRCIDFLRAATPEAVAELVNELLDEHGEQLSQDIVDFLRNSRQVAGIGLRPDRLDDDAWELLDQTQAFIATRLDGILAILGDGIYDRDLQLLVDLGESSA